MSRDELALRLLAERAEISSERIRRGQLEKDHFSILMSTTQRIAETPIWIDETGGLTIAQLCTRARRAKRKHDIGLVVVDYIQLMSGSRRENRTQDISEITMGLKALAKELHVPIVALSQLSRNVESREDKRPQLSDLRESGSIEQDADVVLFVYREEYYHERRQPPIGDYSAHADWQARMTEVAGKADVIIGKQRHGSTGSIAMSFDAPLTRFSNLAREVR
jgi:replicative DNA helicase